MQVGPSEKSFVVHTDVITRQSLYFRAACSDRWLKEGSKALKLPDDDADIFEIYLHWLYSSEVHVGDTEMTLEDEEEYGNEVRFDMRCVRLFVLADKLGDVTAANAVSDRIVDNCEETRNLFSKRAVRVAFEQLPQNSPLRRFCIDYYVHECHTTDIQPLTDDEATPKAALAAMLLEKTRLDSDNRGERMQDVFQNQYTTCHKKEYHQHDDAHPPEKCNVCQTKMRKRGDEDDGEEEGDED